MHLMKEINHYMPAFRKKLIKFLHKIKKSHKFGFFIDVLDYIAFLLIKESICQVKHGLTTQSGA